MKLFEPLICAGLKAVFNIPDSEVESVAGKAGEKIGSHLPTPGNVFNWLKGRFTDHSLTLTIAVSTAQDRACQAVALALATDNIFTHVSNFFRDGDMMAVQKQIRAFVNTADTGLEGTTDRLRASACDELLRLKKAGRFGHQDDELTLLDMTRFASAADVADDAHRAVGLIAADLAADAPHLAQVLTLTPPNGGTPLLAAAFAYFLRRQIATNSELARELHYDQLRLLTQKQQAGFESIEQVIETTSGQLLEALGG